MESGRDEDQEGRAQGSIGQRIAKLYQARTRHSVRLAFQMLGLFADQNVSFDIRLRLVELRTGLPGEIWVQVRHAHAVARCPLLDQREQRGRKQ
ncbi:hypothetical protein GCM10008959_38780 [Deinococcus seoulensis]|uniref:Uncharacterized protein n=1 Tax=Deinococcus seoulensis TaxID=1837379 RepID=A0ABQ2S0R0_9DEIO|nr:hypothetical protein GCM10008959_38780 [Deinococcus seoulensis]